MPDIKEVGDVIAMREMEFHTNNVECLYMDSSSFASNLLMAVGSTAYVYPAS